MLIADLRSGQTKREDLEERTKKFTIRVMRMVDELPRTRSNDLIGKQLVRCASSIGANYREAGRAESRNDFVHKIGICAKEAAEAQYWLELIADSTADDDAKSLLEECDELLRIMVASVKTAQSRR